MARNPGSKARGEHRHLYCTTRPDASVVQPATDFSLVSGFDKNSARSLALAARRRTDANALIFAAAQSKQLASARKIRSPRYGRAFASFLGVQNGTVSDAGAACRKKPPPVSSYDDATVPTAPSDAGGAVPHRPAAPEANRPARPVLGHRWGHHRDQQNSLAACRHRCARTGSPLGSTIEMGLGSIVQRPDGDGPDQARSFIRPHGGRMFPARWARFGSRASPHWLSSGLAQILWRQVSAPRAGRCPTQALARRRSPTRRPLLTQVD